MVCGWQAALVSSYDVLVIGGGIAGASIGHELAADRSVGLLEMEPTLAFHTTGRSVATFLESYGGRTIRLLTTASRAFMEDPPDGFTRPLLKALPLVWVAPHSDLDDLRSMHAPSSGRHRAGTGSRRGIAPSRRSCHWDRMAPRSPPG